MLVGLLVITVAPAAADAAVVADSVTEFSGTQGQDNWRYGHYNRSTDGVPGYQQTDFVEFPTVGAFPRFDYTGANWDYIGADGTTPQNPPWTTLSATGGHPNGTNNGEEHWAIRRWQATQSGNLQVTYDVDTGGWTNTQLYVNGNLKFVRTIPGAQPRMQDTVIVPNVQVGDLLDFVLDPNGNDGSDTTVLQMTIDDQVTGGKLLDGTVHTNSAVDFSFGGTQGENNWTYGYHNVTLNDPYEATPGGTDDMIPFPNDGGPYSPTNFWTGEIWDWFAGNQPWTEIGPAGGHPNGDNQPEEHWTIRRWESDLNGATRIDWSLSKTNAGCGNGASLKVLVNGVEVDAGTVAWNDSSGITGSVKVNLAIGDFVDIAHTSEGTDGGHADGCDGSALTASVVTGIAPTLEWDQLGNGNWGQVVAGVSNWLDGGVPVAWFPDLGTPAEAVVRTDTVTVAADREAVSLTAESGAVDIAAGQKLTVFGQTEFLPGSALGIGNGATLLAIGGGSVAEVNVAGTATIVAEDDMSVSDITDGGTAATFVKDGGGTMTVGGSTVTMVPDSVVEVAGGVLRSDQPDAIGAAETLVLSGGTFSTTGAPVLVPGLMGGTLAGNMNRTAPNPQNQGIDPLGPSASESAASPPWAGNTTWVYTGEISIGPSGVASFFENIDDITWLVIDGETLLDDAGWNVPTSGTIARPEGWYQFELRMSNGGGGAGIVGPLGFGHSPTDTGGSTVDTDYTHPQNSDPGTADMFRTTAADAIDMSHVNVIVRADSGLETISHLGSASFGPLTLEAGILQSTGVGGMSFDGTTIDPAATDVGVDPRVATEYGQIDGSGAAATFTKAGPNTLTLDTPNVNLQNATLRADGGTLRIVGSDPWGGSTKMVLNSGVFEVAAAGAGPSVVPAGAIAEWKFEEGMGLVAADTSTAGANTPGDLIADVEWVVDPERGSVIGLDSWDDYVDVPGFNLTTDTVTFTAWINAHKNANWAGIVQSRGTQATGMGYGDDDGLHYTWNDNSNTSWGWTGGPSIPDDQWVLVAVAIEPTQMAAYVGSDGMLSSGVNAIPHIVQTIDAVQLGRDNCCGTNRFLVGMMDDVRIYDRALTGAEIAGLAGAQHMDMTTHTVQVTGDSTLRAVGLSAAFGPLTMTDGVLITEGAPGGISFNGGPKAPDTIIDPAAVAVGFNPQTPTDVGLIDGSGAGATISKVGGGDLVIDEANVNLAGSVFEAQGGRLIARPAEVPGKALANPFEQAGILINGGEVVLSATAGVEPPITEVTFDTPVEVVADGTITAGAAGNGTAGVAVTLGSPAKASPVTLTSGILSAQATDNYSLIVAGDVSGAGGLSAPAGSVTLDSLVDVGSLAVEGGDLAMPNGGMAADFALSDGNLAAGGNVNVARGNVSGGTVDLGANAIVVSESMVVDRIMFSIDPGNTMAATAADGSDMVVGTDLTFSGGVLSAHGPSGGRIGINFRRSDGGQTLMDPTDVAGVVAHENWNNGPEADNGTQADVVSPTAGVLVDQTGAPTAVTMAFSAQTSWSTNYPPNSGDEKMMSGYSDTTDDNAPGTYDFDNIPYLEYAAYVYVGSDGDDRFGGVSIDGGVTETFYQTFGNTNQFVDTGYVQATAATQAEAIQSNYILFEELTSTTLNIQNDRKGTNCGVHGIQIVETSATDLVDASHINVIVTAGQSPTAELTSTGTGDVILGDLTIEDGVTALTISAPVTVNNLTTPQSTTVDGSLTALGNIRPGGSAGLLNINAVAGAFEFGEDATYHVEIAEWDSPGDLPPVPPLPDPPMDPTINDRIHATSGDVFLDGDLTLAALTKLHPRVLHPDFGVEVEWYGDQTRVIASTEGENQVGWQFAAVPDPQPESWDDIMTGTAEWSQGHIGRGAFLTRNNGGGENDAPGISYTPNATKVHVFQACDGDTNGDRTLGGRDIQNIQSFALFGIQEDPGPGFTWPPDWPQGDFDGDGLVTGLDISAILATGLWPTADYAAIDPGEPLDGVVDLLLYPEDVTLEDGTVVPAGTLMIDPDGLTLNGYVLRSAEGIFTGAPAQQLNWFFVEDTDRQISGNMGATIVQVQDLGPVVGPEWTIINPFEKQDVNPFDDLTLTYTVAGTPGTFVGNLIIVPEPSTIVMLLAGAVGLLLLRRRRRTA